MRLSIRRKLVLAIGVPLVVVYASTTWILVSQLRARSRDRLERIASERVRILASQVEPILDRAAGAARLAASLVDGSLEPAAGVEGALRVVLENEPAIVRLRARLGEKGNFEWTAVRAGSGIQVTGPDRPGPIPADVAAERFGPARTDPALGEPATTFSSAIGGASFPGSAIFADVPFSRLSRPLAELATDDLRMVLLARDGTVLWASHDARATGRNFFLEARGSGRDDLAVLERRLRDGEAGIALAPGLLRNETVWFGFAPLRSVDASVVAAVPEAVGFAFERNQIGIGLGILTAGLVFILAVLFAASAAITRPLSRLARAVADLGGGDLEAHVSGVASRDETGDLARGFDRMVRDLKGHVAALEREAAAREAVLGEMRVAREIQTALLPKKLPSGPGFALHARNLAARHVAGDFFDAFEDSGRVVFLVADVSGKGLPSALFMAVSRIVLRRVLVGAASLSEAVREANDSLESEGVGSMYLTLYAGSFDPATGNLRYVNAGHPLPWSVSASGAPRPLGEVTGPPVGLLPGRPFEEREATLEAGDRLVVFTDGVPEARRGEEFYGDERLARLLAAGPAGEGSAALLDRVVAEVEIFQGGNLADDVTVLVLGRG